MDYYSQKKSKYADCLPLALANACKFYGISCPIPHSEMWEEVIDFAGCRHGSACASEEEIADFFGLCAVPVQSSQIVGREPVLLTVLNPEVGHNLHSVLVVEWKENVSTVINYRACGPTVECVPFELGGSPPLKLRKFEEGLGINPGWHAVPDRSVRWGSLYIPKPPNNRCFMIEQSKKKKERMPVDFPGICGERIHKDIGRGRVVKTARNKKDFLK